MNKINMQNQPEFGKQLLSIIQRIEKLNEDAEQVAADIKAVYDEAKSAGFDVKCVKKMVAAWALVVRMLFPKGRTAMSGVWTSPDCNRICSGNSMHVSRRRSLLSGRQPRESAAMSFLLISTYPISSSAE